MKLAIIACAALLIGCGETRMTEVTIISTIQEGEWGCIGEDVKTILETEAGFRDDVCGYWGEPGDTFNAYFVTGHFDHIKNGIRLTR